MQIIANMTIYSFMDSATAAWDILIIFQLAYSANVLADSNQSIFSLLVAYFAIWLKMKGS